MKRRSHPTPRTRTAGRYQQKRASGSPLGAAIFLAILPIVDVEHSMDDIEAKLSPFGYSLHDYCSVCEESADLDRAIGAFLVGKRPLPEGVTHEPLYLGGGR